MMTATRSLNRCSGSLKISGPEPLPAGVGAAVQPLFPPAEGVAVVAAGGGLCQCLLVDAEAFGGVVDQRGGAHHPDQVEAVPHHPGQLFLVNLEVNLEHKSIWVAGSGADHGAVAMGC
jgi:hypothetical protein